MDSFFKVVFTLYLGLFTWLLLIIKKSSESQVNLIKEQIAQKDVIIENLEHENKKLYEDTDPVKWKAKKCSRVEFQHKGLLLRVLKKGV